MVVHKLDLRYYQIPPTATNLVNSICVRLQLPLPLLRYIVHEMHLFSYSFDILLLSLSC